MRFKILPVKNVMRMKDAADALVNRSYGQPGLGTVTGESGTGKTTSTTWLVNQVNGVYVRAIRLWTAGGMLGAISAELDLEVRRMTNGEKLKAIVAALAESGRPLFIDEADYVVDSGLLTDTLRDIHDMSTAPIILIGMGDIERKIRGNKQFSGRVAQWVHFQGIDLADARLLASGLCEAAVADDLVASLHGAAGVYGSGASKRSKSGDAESAEMRRFVVGLNQIERYAAEVGLERVTLADWPKGRSFFIGHQPAKKAKVTALRPVGGKDDK